MCGRLRESLWEGFWWGQIFLSTSYPHCGELVDVVVLISVLVMAFLAYQRVK